MRVIYTQAITRDVRKVKDKKVIDRVATVVRQLEAASSLNELSAVKKMAGYATAYRIRVGGYRLGFYYEDDHVVLARFLKRSDIYQVFP